MMTSRREVEEQYRDAANLNARSAIYRFGDPNATPWPRWVFDQLSDLPRDARVLEIGCGDGGLWKRNAERVPAGWEIVLLDLSPGMLAAIKLGLPFRRVQGDAERLPFADDTFHAVIANHMLYHVADRPRALSDIRRVLVPAGRLFAGTNSASHMARMKDLVEHCLGERSPLAGAMPFSLENGEAQLRGWFDRVEIRRTGGELRVTDPDVIVRYVMSMPEAPQRIAGPRLDELQRLARDEIAAKGAYVFTTAAGLFIATKTAV
jgi:SAM-dependent methyltransferase